MNSFFHTIFYLMSNTLLVSIPEESFLTALYLLLLKRFDALEFDKNNLKRFLAAVLIPAVLSNVIRQFSIDGNGVLPIFVLSIYVTAILIYKMYSLKKLFAAFVSILISVVVWMVIEFTYVPYLFHLLNVTVEEVNSSVLNNFLLSLPERIIESIIIWRLWVKRFNVLKVDIVKSIISSWFLSILSIVLLGINVFILGLGGKYIIFDRYLNSLPLSAQMFFVIETLILPIFNMVVLYAVVYTIKYKEAYNKLVEKDHVSTLVAIIDESIEGNKLGNVKKAMDDIKKLM